MSYPPYPKYKDSGVEWLGEVPEGWEVKRLRFMGDINPSKNETINIDRNTEVSFLPMEAIGDNGFLNLERTRRIGEVEIGYTYFGNGDVTMAKITPCFENGKGAIMQGLLGGIGFGTTELTVLRPCLNKTTSKYLYWIFISTPFRKLGEATMYGAGGQKRVPDDFVRNFEIAFPPLPEQTLIAAFLDRETSKIDALTTEYQTLIALLAEKRQAMISQAVTKGLNPNVKMKDSGVEWLGEVPEGWEVKRIKYLSTRISSGKTPLGGSEVYVDEGIIFLRSQNVYDEGLRLDDVVFITAEVDESMAVSRVVPNDILLNITGASIGRSCVVPTEFSSANVNQHVCVIRLQDIHQVPFVGLLFKATVIKNQIDYMQNGAAREGLNFVQIGEISIPLPPLPEQILIASFLDRETSKIDALTTEAKRAIDLLKESRSALISAAVTGKIDVRGFSCR
ncbi:type I restriction enzyme, S subunit [Gammaproteobacteria bacterium]